MPGKTPEIPGVKAERSLAEEFRREVANLLGRSQLTFPGAQPVSFARRHIQDELLQRDYYVCEKSDGIRCLLFCTSDGPGNEIHYLIDRKNDYYYVQNLHFPLPEDRVEFHERTLFDGELVMDKTQNGGYQLKYLVFDCMLYRGDSLMQRPLDKRLAYFKEYVLKPYHKLYREFPDEIQFLPFIIEDKKVHFSYGIEDMFRLVLPNLPHGNDGLIFTCRETAYKFGTDEHILKWKPQNENSIDFLLSLEFPEIQPDSEDEANGITEPYSDYTAMPNFGLYVMHEKNDFRRYSEMFMEDAEWEAMKAKNEPLDEAIVECYMDNKNRWRFLRIRTDKDFPNFISTVQSVIESIQDKVSEGELVHASRDIRASWKQRQTKREQSQRKQ
ncbi:MAG: Dcp1p-Dcp2p decapping enzyme complex alpha subunit [Cirrosporium novae-zelandiae]|nr:MAG: Dcp1p-Dcp2p decapping enzyme complex alpha subunit [Cirrosporium novae-zelandiae]